MRMAEIMTPSIAVVPEHESAELAHERMLAERIHHLVVINGSRITGVISERDLGGPQGHATRQGRVVADLMSREVVTASPTTTLKEAANKLRGRAIGCLPIVDGRELVGIVTTTDLLELLGRGAEKPNPRSQRATLAKRGSGRRAPLPGMRK